MGAKSATACKNSRINLRSNSPMRSLSRDHNSRKPEQLLQEIVDNSS